MRRLEHGVAGLRAAGRRLAARRGGQHPRRLAPARLVLRLDDADLPGSLGQGRPLALADWHQALVSAVEWLGPLSVTILAHRSAGGATAAELVRFAHRLECRTELVSDGVGLDLGRAEELVDRGLERLRIRMGGVSPEVHQAVVGGDLDAAMGAVRAALEARTERGARLDIEVALPWKEPAQSEARALIGWAREAGVDGFRLLAPWRSEGLPADPELLDAVLDAFGSAQPGFHRTSAATIAELHAMGAHSDGGPGLARADAPACRRHRACPVGGQRLELSAHGRLSACPFKVPIAADLSSTPPVGLSGTPPLDLARAWQQAGPHLREIRSCTRACVHHELAPLGLRS